MAGEIDIIEKCSDSTEKKARLKFVHFVMHYAENVAFEQILVWYADWMRAVERDNLCRGGSFEVWCWHFRLG